jgi:hypothetical protein
MRVSEDAEGAEDGWKGGGGEVECVQCCSEREREWTRAVSQSWLVVMEWCERDDEDECEKREVASFVARGGKTRRSKRGKGRRVSLFI